MIFALRYLPNFRLLLFFRASFVSYEFRIPFPFSLLIISISDESKLRSKSLSSMAVSRVCIRNELPIDCDSRIWGAAIASKACCRRKEVGFR